MKNDKPIYWDNENNKFYWIEWFETGNSDIPIRHYLEFEIKDIGNINSNPIVKIKEEET